MIQISQRELIEQGYSADHAAFMAGLSNGAPPPPAPTARPAAPTAAANADIRAWAREQRIQCPAKGRIPSDVMFRYLEAHGNG